MNKLIDSNLIVRYLIQDDPKKALAVRKLLENNKATLLLTDIVTAELVWTLDSFYHLTRSEILEKLQSLLDLDSIKANKELLSRSLQIYQTYNIDFIDAYLAAYCDAKKNIKGIYSFDKDFDKIKDIKRFEP
ncbi:MAG: PIN domain-containing protein [Candidatus Daviesbacteria bacterium]|nr:PIN domain-containing protein [Candidatus Daviesbacteria bacterium]